MCASHQLRFPPCVEEAAFELENDSCHFLTICSFVFVLRLSIDPRQVARNRMAEVLNPRAVDPTAPIPSYQAQSKEP